MTVQKLIKELQKMPPRARVVVAGYEEGYDDVDSVEPLRLNLNVGAADWAGDHSAADEENGLPAVSAVVIL